MHWELTEHEARVLGVLMEKSLTQPNAYPMTVNGIRGGCNQLQNRDPVLSMSDGDVARALQGLGHKRLATQAPPEPNDRANKFRHRVVEELHWDPREQAVMAELLLRGRQTSGELRTRASRMTPIQDLASITAIIESLQRAAPPFIKELAREPGKSAVRYRHLLGADADESETAVDSHCAAPAAVDQAASIVAPAPASPNWTALEKRLSAIESRITELEQRLSSKP